MYLALESSKLSLPQNPQCIAFSAEAKKVMNSPGAWRDLQQLAALALQSFANAAGGDAVVWFSDVPFTDANNTSGKLLTAYFGTDATTTKAQLDALEVPFSKAPGWSADGVHARPSEAFPSLAVRHGQLHQIWVEEGGEQVCTAWSGFGSRISRVQRSFARSVDKEFLPHVRHSIAIVQPRDPTKDRHKRQLVAAYAISIARRIAGADGVVDDTERAFIDRLFPPEELADLWIDDPQLLEAMARQAPAELPKLLAHHEKLALLSTFYAASYADGKVDVRELKVLKDAAEGVGLESAEVVAQLKRLW